VKAVLVLAVVFVASVFAAAALAGGDPTGVGGNSGNGSATVGVYSGSKHLSYTVENKCVPTADGLVAGFVVTDESRRLTNWVTYHPNGTTVYEDDETFDISLAGPDATCTATVRDSKGAVAHLDYIDTYTT
jgi:hypothetical protein